MRISLRLRDVNRAMTSPCRGADIRQQNRPGGRDGFRGGFGEGELVGEVLLTAACHVAHDAGGRDHAAVRTLVCGLLGFECVA